MFDRNQRVSRLNRQMADWAGCGPGLGAGQPLSELFPSLAARLAPMLARAWAGEAIPDWEVQSEDLGPGTAGRILLASLELTGHEMALLLRDVTEERALAHSLSSGDVAFRQLFHSNPAPMWVYDRETLCFLEVNQAALEVYGWSREAFLSMTILDIRPEDERERVRRMAREPRAARKLSGPWRHLDAAGRERLLHAASYLLDFAGRAAVLVTGWDVTDHVRAQEALRASEEFARGILESSTDCMKVLDLGGRLLFLNGAGLALMEVDDFERLRGRPWTAFLPEEMAEEARRALEAARAGQPSRFTGFTPTLRGTPKWWEVVISPIRGPSGAVVRLLSISRDITERRAAEQRIVYLAHHDPLTDLPNRRLFRECLEEAIGTQRPGERLALLCLDLDGFKAVNDTMGHPVGDGLLRKVAERLRGCLRDGDTVARTGGDEFAVIQTGLRSPADAAALAHRIVTLLNQDYEIEGLQVHAGCSLGVAILPEGAVSADELVRKADLALCRAKADGRGVFRFFERQMEEVVRRGQALRAGLRTALERGELSLHFQPLLRIGGGVSCLEALMRWQHPVLGAISPAEFIPVAEESGLIPQMGEWALRTACQEAARWPEPVRVAVNLSPVQFRRPGLVRAVATALGDAGLPAERLELEITESVLLGEEEANLETLRQLRALGLRIALDDFGTGFSSLGYLLRFAFDKIKIDRSFVAGLPGREDAQAIIRAIIGMGQGLGLSIAAEGVETEGQLAALAGKGCAEVQGYLFSPPVPAAEVPGLLRRLRQAGPLPA